MIEIVVGVLLALGISVIAVGIAKMSEEEAESAWKALIEAEVRFRRANDKVAASEEAPRNDRLWGGPKAR